MIEHCILGSLTPILVGSRRVYYLFLINCDLLHSNISFFILAPPGVLIQNNLHVSRIGIG